jgi:hypothetical protein
MSKNRKKDLMHRGDMCTEIYGMVSYYSHPMVEKTNNPQIAPCLLGPELVKAPAKAFDTIQQQQQHSKLDRIFDLSRPFQTAKRVL